MKITFIDKTRTSLLLRSIFICWDQR